MNKKGTPRGFFRNLPIRFKLLIVYITVFTLAITAENIVIYSLVRRTIEANIQSELSNTTSTMVNMVRTTANASIKNYLRAIAEKNRDIVAHIYSQYQAGLLTEKAAKELATGILLSQTIGETGYIYSLNSQGILEVHPREPLRGADISEYAFVQEQIRRKEGYLEYEWANPGEPAERPKALYMTYFEPWDWIISASSYREEFTTLVNVDDFRDDILSIHFGETGYPYVMDSQGTLVIHPQLEGSNIIDSQDANGRMFIKEISERKTGEIIYPWQNPGEPAPREKLAIFDYIPEFDWIVASSSYLEEFYAPLTAMAKTVTLTVLISLLLVLPLTIWLSATITRPLQQLMTHFAQGAGGDLTVRMQVNSKDEVGRLASYFNNFMGKLETEISERQQAEEELQRYREHLEELVEARTAELNDMTQKALQAHQAAEAARQTAEQANRAKSTFLANMSHELRTPLNAILGYSQLMGRDPHLTPTQQEYLETIARSGEHLLGLINNVLTMSKIEAGRTTLQENAFDLHRQLHGLQEMFQIRADDKGIGLLLDIAPGVRVTFTPTRASYARC